MNRQKLELLGFYVKGLVFVFLHVAVASLVLTWVLQGVAMAFGEGYDWGSILTHIFLSMSFLVMFPGQQVWTYRLEGRDKRVYTIVGREAYFDHYPDGRTDP